jgi:hypothetical protein
MRKLLIRSVIIALSVGSCIGFANYVASVHGAGRYDPPVSEDEWRRSKDLPVAKIEEALSGRRKPLTRVQWVEESISYSYFWTGVARDSVAPILGVFIACIFIGILQTPERQRSAPAAVPKFLK